ncbi:unnamed protein product [Urochloa humidicola]
MTQHKVPATAWLADYLSWRAGHGGRWCRGMGRRVAERLSLRQLWQGGGGGAKNTSGRRGKGSWANPASWLLDTPTCLAPLPSCLPRSSSWNVGHCYCSKFTAPTRPHHLIPHQNQSIASHRLQIHYCFDRI